MSYNSQITSNNTELENIKSAVSDIEEGTGGSSIETCTITINNSAMAYNDFHIYYTAYINNILTTIEITSNGEEEFILSNVVIGSKLIFLVGMSAGTTGLVLCGNNEECIGDISYDHQTTIYQYRTEGIYTYFVNVSGHGTLNLL